MAQVEPGLCPSEKHELDLWEAELAVAVWALGTGAEGSSVRAVFPALAVHTQPGASPYSAAGCRMIGRDLNKGHKSIWTTAWYSGAGA